MAHWRDGGIGNMAGSDDRPIEEWTLLERLNNFEAFFYKTEPDAETIQMLTRRAADVIAAIPQWQLIDTAPKDGTEVLGLCDWQPLTVVMFFRDGEWLVKWDEAKLSDGYEATHWMPLPAPKVEA